MKKTAKITLLISVISIAFVLLMSASLGASTIQIQWAQNDWYDNSTYTMSIDTSTKTATVLSVDSCYYDVVIPESFNYNNINYTVTGVTGTTVNYLESVEIPATVTYISPKAIGYDANGEKINTYLQIYCYEGTAAEQYAQSNSFEAVKLYRVSDSCVTLSGTSFIFTGDYIEPSATVTVNGTTISGNDYFISYTSNYSVGTAYAEINFYSGSIYRGNIKKSFKITPAPATKLKYASVGTQTYTGYKLTPWTTVTYNGMYLYEDTDFTVSYSSNLYPGTGKMVLKFKGNYSGTKTINFKIALDSIKNLKITPKGNQSVDFSWDYVPCDQYRIYIYDTSAKKYKLIGTSEYPFFTYRPSKALYQIKTYKFAVKAAVHTKSKSYSGKVTYKSATTGLKDPNLYLATKKKSVTLKWTKNKYADGYIVYKYNNSAGDFKKYKTITNGNTTSWKDTKANSKGEYYYYLVSYDKRNSKYYYSSADYYYSSASGDSRLNGASLKSHRKIKVYNVQPKKTKYSWTYTLSNSDIKILKNFANKHFKKGMLPSEKVAITLEWINRNTKYARGSAYNKIAKLSYVNAIFNKKSGQCVQYNGALAAMMAYLGYDVRIVQGYRGNVKGNKWQHFWVEVVIDGQTYIMETGNYESCGSWSYYCAKYSETSKYIRNGKNM